MRPFRNLVAAVGVGLAAGAASALFLATLAVVTDWRLAHPTMIWFLPVAGAAMALVYAKVGGRAVHGTRLTMSEIDDLRDGVPLRMAPLVLGATLGTHAFGGSAGREGTAVQMSASLTDGITRRLRFDPRSRRLLLVAALAGGFGSVFGVPWAGVVFAMEVAPTTRRVRFTALPASLIASWVGHLTVVRLGLYEHPSYPAIGWPSFGTILRAIPVGLALGVIAWAFVRLTELISHTSTRWLGHLAARAVVGGVAILAMTALVGNRDYLGLSLPLLDQATRGIEVAGAAFALKLLFTAVTVGSGYQGGEVTPLFVVGATAGSTLGGWLGGPREQFACMGMLAVFGAAANTPLACVVMGVEILGWRATPLLLVGCLLARAASTRRHLYEPVEA